MSQTLRRKREEVKEKDAEIRRLTKKCETVEAELDRLAPLINIARQLSATTDAARTSEEVLPPSQPRAISVPASHPSDDESEGSVKRVGEKGPAKARREMR